ncbi:MAG: tRNA (adenosine(37)-N6)-threonylcarbamoyltransferase complex dimerization subunit type 1 TsaB [Bacteroidales bacterium]
MINKAPTTLLIETSTEVCSVALSLGSSLIGQKISRIPRAHTAIISVITQELLEESKISLAMCDAIVVSKGPGSYTGLRVGVSFAKGLCFGTSKPLIAVGSLTLLATLASTTIDLSNIKPSIIVPMIDARRMEVYTASYSPTGEKLTPVEALIVDSQSFSSQLEQGVVLFCGDGSSKVSKIIKHPNARFVNIEALAQGMIPQAVEKYHKGKFEDVAYFEPFYLKDFIAGVSKKNPLQI